MDVLLPRGAGVWLGTLAGLALLRPAAAGEDPAVAAHRASRDSILTCRCTFKVARFQGEDGRVVRAASTGSYLRSGPTSRLTLDLGGERIDYVEKDSKAWLVSGQKSGKSELVGAGVRVADNKPVRFENPWYFGLLSFPLPDGQGFVPLEDLLGKATRRKVRDEAGKPVITVTVPTVYPDTVPDGWEAEVRLAPDRNYLADRVVTTQKLKSGPVARTELSVSEFKEVSPGLFFPVKAEGKSYFDGKVSAGIESVIEQVVVNQPLAPEAFDLRYRHGTPFTDHIRQVRYSVDASGRPITAETPLPSEPAGSAPGDARRPPPKPDTTDEPRRSAHWFLLAGSLATLVAAVYLRVRRSRRASPA